MKKNSAKTLDRELIHSLIQAIFYLTVSITLYIQVKQLLLRTKMGYGLTDEAYGLSYAIERGKNGQQGNTALFADITSIPLTLTGFDIQNFRLFGLFVIILIIIYLVYFHIISNDTSTWVKKLPVCLVAFSILLTIPTNFRYLLITPSYQWIVMLFAILAVSLILVLTQRQSLRIFPQYLLSLSILLVTLSRPTSGLMLWLLINTYILFKTNLFKVRLLIQLNMLIFTFFSCYAIFNWKAVTAFIERYVYLKNLDPSGSNLWSESLDILVSFLFVWSIFIFGREILKYLFREKPNSWQPKSKGLIISFSILFAFSVTKVATAHPDSLHLLLAVFVLFMGSANYFYGDQKFDLPKALLTSAPILTQFGSNTSSSYLVSPFLISVLMYTFFESRLNFEQGSPSKLFRKSVFKNLTNVALTFIILILTVSQINFSYETHLPSSELEIDSVSSLYYSPQKLERIQKFREEAGVSGEYTGEKILDLSFWHPGAILYLGGLQFPFAVDNKVFRKTLHIQVSSTIKQIDNLDPERLPSIIVETSKIKVTKTCLELSEYIEDRELKHLLNEFSFNPRMKSMSIYLSDPVDLTLYPKNISYLVPCPAG